ncbi:hypothetical protein PG985_007909 [Apiospora marii]|uniref:uncharacterized protein n=1 Tax=Apiospora marii TaxID=335849 RepID=UPI003131B76A
MTHKIHRSTWVVTALRATTFISRNTGELQSSLASPSRHMWAILLGTSSMPSTFATSTTRLGLLKQVPRDVTRWTRTTSSSACLQRLQLSLYTNQLKLGEDVFIFFGEAPLPQSEEPDILYFKGETVSLDTPEAFLAVNPGDSHQCWVIHLVIDAILKAPSVVMAVEMGQMARPRKSLREAAERGPATPYQPMIDEFGLSMAQ